MKSENAIIQVTLGLNVKIIDISQASNIILVKATTHYVYFRRVDCSFKTS